MVKLPRLNSYIWLIVFVEGVPYTVSKQQVYMKNKTEFITEEAVCDGVIDEARYSYGVEDYGSSWFKSLKEAKIGLENWIKDQKKYFNDNYTYSLEKIGDSFYDVILENNKLEDLEEELDMPLDKAIDLLFKAIKNS